MEPAHAMPQAQMPLQAQPPHESQPQHHQAVPTPSTAEAAAAPRGRLPTPLRCSYDLYDDRRPTD
eukprot:scaffold34115_cov30-Tisochrysis_lutea.AAC.1